MKLQHMVDNGRVSPDTVPEKSQNKNQTMRDIEISLNGILKLLFNLKPGKSKRKAMNRNWCNQKANPALNTKAGNK